MSWYGPLEDLCHLLSEILFFLLVYYIIISKWCLAQIYHLCDFIFKFFKSWILLIILWDKQMIYLENKKLLFKCSCCSSSGDVSCCLCGRGFNQWAWAYQRDRKGTCSVQVHFFILFWFPYKRKNDNSALEGWALNLEKEQI